MYSSSVPMLKETVGKDEILDQDNWYIKNRHRLTDTFFFGVLILHILVLMGLFFLALGLSAPSMWNQFSFSDDSCAKHTFLFAAYGILLIYLIVVIGILIYFFRKHLRGVRDGLHFKRDLKVIGTLWLIGGIGYGVFAIVYLNSVGKAIFPLYAFTLVYCLTTGRSIYESFTSPSNSRRSMAPDLEDEPEEQMELIQVLKSNSSKQRFREFLQSEWSAENLLFWEDIDYFHKIQGIDNVQREGLKIFDKYFAERAVLQLNLSFMHVRKVRTAVEECQKDPVKWSTEIFDDAQKAMFHLMATDSFVRFKQKRRENRISSEIDPRSSTELRRSVEIDRSSMEIISSKKKSNIELPEIKQ